MSKLLDLAIARTRRLPEHEQDRAPEILLRAIDPREPSAPLDDETIFALNEALGQAERREFASESEILALWKRHGL